MRQEYIWEAGTSVLLAGYPRSWLSGVKPSTVFAGRLAEPFCYGGAVLMEPGPMAVNLSARGWLSPSLLVHAWNRDPLSGVEYLEAVHRAWKGGFQLNGRSPKHGCRMFHMFRDFQEVSERLFHRQETIVERLEAEQDASWPVLQSYTPDIHRVIAWFLGGHQETEAIPIDLASGEPLKHCRNCNRWYPARALHSGYAKQTAFGACLKKK